MDVSCPKCARGVRLTPAELASKDRLRAVKCATCGSSFDARLLIAQGKSAASALAAAPGLASAIAPPKAKPVISNSGLLKKAPDRIGSYDVIDEINRGGMGIVYKAVDPQLKRKVAIKVLLAGEGATESDVMRFKREAQATARLQHPNIVPIYSVGEHDGKPYFVMDFIEGQTAKQLKDRGEMTPRLALKIIEGTADALYHAHTHGVFHRDVKPANIIVDADERPQLMDFGLARREDEDLEITQSGTTMGTPSYMSPEQAEGRLDEVDGQSDVYSAGACLYELLTGRPPFEGETTLGVLRQIIDDPPIPPRKLNPAINHDVETICLKCLEKNKRARYANAKELADDIRHFNAGEAISAKPLGAMGRFWRQLRRHKELSIAALVMLLSGLGVIAYTFTESRAAVRKQVDDRLERFKTSLRAGHEELERAHEIIQTFAPPKPPGSETPAPNFERTVTLARETLTRAENHLRQAEALFPDNPELKTALDRHRRIELEADVKRYIVKARMFMTPPAPNFAGAEFAAQEAVDRDPKNIEARKILREARGVRKVTLIAEIRNAGNAPVTCDVYARKLLDSTGQSAPATTALGLKLGPSPVQDAELEPGFYIISFVRKGLPEPQQATFLLTRGASDSEAYLSFPMDAKEENMVQISAGETRAGGVAKKVPAFSIDRYEYPNRPGEEPKTGFLSLTEAEDDCKKKGKHVCTQAQWQRACAGDSGRRFPYGDTYLPGVCVLGLDGTAQTHALFSGKLTRCKTPDGVYDMTGNAAEWASSDGSRGNLLGGDWTGSIQSPDLSGSCRTIFSAEDVNVERRGFRCCK